MPKSSLSLAATSRTAAAAVGPKPRTGNTGTEPGGTAQALQSRLSGLYVGRVACQPSRRARLKVPRAARLVRSLGSWMVASRARTSGGLGDPPPRPAGGESGYRHVVSPGSRPPDASRPDLRRVSVAAPGARGPLGTFARDCRPGELAAGPPAVDIDAPPTPALRHHGRHALVRCRLRRSGGLRRHRGARCANRGRRPALTRPATTRARRVPS